jgi:hypothetical protein
MIGLQAVFDPEGHLSPAHRRCDHLQGGKDKLDANAEMWAERQRAYGLNGKAVLGSNRVAVDDENRIFVCESARNRIQVYCKLSPTFVGPRL